jgi:hypothetical protein
MNSSEDCPHTPRCQTTCRICGEPLPEWFEVPQGSKKVFVVHFENGSTNTIFDVQDEIFAKKAAMTGIARAAGLCFDHMVRVTKVVEKRKGDGGTGFDLSEVKKHINGVGKIISDPFGNFGESK